jgi:hypothetical protein
MLVDNIYKFGTLKLMKNLDRQAGGEGLLSILHSLTFTVCQTVTADGSDYQSWQLPLNPRLAIDKSLQANS